jgi:chemotaxis protein CheC
MSNSSLITVTELSQLRDVVSSGFENAARGLSMMVNKDIRVLSPSLRVIPIEQVPNLVGQPDEEVVAIYLQLSGDVSGHMMLILSVEAAEELVGMLMGPRSDPSADLDEMEQSALGEVANVTGAFFLSALGDAVSLVMQPSPPQIMKDMAGAALGVPLTPLAMSMADVLSIDTWFLDEERQIRSMFLVLPNADSLRLILERLNGTK